MKYTIIMKKEDYKITVFIKNKKELKEWLDNATSEELNSIEKIKKN